MLLSAVFLVSGHWSREESTWAWDVPCHLIRRFVRELPTSGTALWRHDSQGSSDGDHSTWYQPTGDWCSGTLLFWGDCESYHFTVLL